MPSYAVAHMRQVTMGPAVVEYLQRIDATLAPWTEGEAENFIRVNPISVWGNRVRRA